MTTAKLLAGCFLSWVLTVNGVAGAQQVSRAKSSTLQADVLEQLAKNNYGKLPLTFEANHGQTDPRVKFLSRGPGYTVLLTSNGMELSLRPSAPVHASIDPQGSANLPASVLKFDLVGASPNPQMIGEGLQSGKVNYFIGSNPNKWRTNVPTFAKVHYKDIYPGIDLVYYGNNRQVEYDFVVGAGADASKIQFEIEGADGLQVNQEGDLVLSKGDGELRFKAPVIYQERAGNRMPLSGGFVVQGGTRVKFDVAPYDTTKPIVIDPVLVYSTYMGGSSTDRVSSIAVDASGNAYIAGYTLSSDFVLTGLNSVPDSAWNVFVVKLDASGSNMVYADYLGGSASDYGNGIAVDGTGAAYVTGMTCSSDFPVKNSYQQNLLGCFDAFLSKVAPDGASLIYSTFLGGSGFSGAYGVAVDTSHQAYIAGYTTATDFPTVNAYQPTALPNENGLYGIYGFVTKFSANGLSLPYSTYLAGNSNVAQPCSYDETQVCWPSPTNIIRALSLDANGNVYVTGTTNAYNFPTTDGAYQTKNLVPFDTQTGFVSKINSSGSLGYSTYFGGFGGNPIDISAIATDNSGSAYIVGQASNDGSFPLTSTSICDPSAPGSSCGPGFIAKFNASGSALAYSTFFPPNSDASPSAITVNSSGEAVVAATLPGGSLVPVNPIQTPVNSCSLMVMQISYDAASQQFSTCLGGSDSDVTAGLAVDSNGNIYVAGYTSSSDLPVTPTAFQKTSAGEEDGFVMKLATRSAPAVSITPAAPEFPAQNVGSQSQSVAVILRNMGSASLTIDSIRISSDFTQTNDCGTNVPPASSCNFNVTFIPSAPGASTGALAVIDNAEGSPHSISLSGTGIGGVASLNSTSLAFAGILVGTTSAIQTVTVTNIGNAPLTVTSVQAAGDFTQTNNCGTLAAGDSCAVRVTFTPTVFGSRTGTITIGDSTGGASKIVSLTGSGIDFTMTANPSTFSVKAGGTATYRVTLAPLGGSLSSAMTLACSGAPNLATCSVSPSSVTLGTNSSTVTVTIATTGTEKASIQSNDSTHMQYASLWTISQGLGMFGMMFAGAGDRRKKKYARYLILVVLALSILLLAACAGGTGVNNNQPPASGTPGTPAGTYTVQVTGTFAGVHHSLPLTLTVQ